MREINIGGQSRPVIYNLNALIEFEELAGVDVINGLDKSVFTKLKNIRALAFCGLKAGFQENSKEVLPFTLEDVGRWVNVTDMGEFYKAFNEDNSTDSTEPPEEGAKK